MVVVSSWQIVLQEQDTQTSPVLIGDLGLFAGRGDCLADSYRPTEVPDIIMGGQEIRQDFEQAGFAFLCTLRFDADDLCGFQVDGAQNLCAVGIFDGPEAVLFKINDAVSLMGAAFSVLTSGQKALDGTLSVPFVLVWHASCATSKEQSDLVNHMVMRGEVSIMAQPGLQLLVPFWEED